MAAADAHTTDASPPPDRATEPAAQYVVVARRYRPQTFEDLIGQEHVVRALLGAIAANRVGHAYLFTGARGVGKTSAARILAKALNCERGPTPTPCNQCDACQSISAGSDVDVLEIDGASNRGIDEIRQLRQNVGIRPSRSRFKIYIIDEVHMLTREAFNALLKTLEEPPEHVKFIFCTTEAAKIPVTILSRCQRFDFAGIQLPSIVERLDADRRRRGGRAPSRRPWPFWPGGPAARCATASRCSNSCSPWAGRRSRCADVHAMLGTAGDAQLSQLAAHLAAHEAAAAIADLDAAIAEGVDVGQLLEQLLGYFRDLLTATVGCPAETLLHAAPGEHEQLAAAGRQLGVESILAIMQILDHTLARLRYTTQSRTLAEMALVRIASLQQLDELSDLIAQLRSGEAPAHRRRPAHAWSSFAAGKKKAESEPAAPMTGGAPVRDDVSGNGRSAAAITLTADNAAEVWQQALSSVQGLLGEYAAQCESVAAVGGTRLVATFRAKYNFSKAFCERPDQLAALEQALAEVVGAPVKVELALLPDEPSAEAPSPRPVPQRQRRAEIAEHPMVRRATELFDARVTRIEEPGNKG